MSDAPADSAETLSLLRQAASGDQKAFDRLFARYRVYIRHIVEMRLDPRIRARVDPSDVIQETQLEVFRRLPDFLARQPMPFRLWLRKTAYERLLVMRRKHVHAANRAVGRELALPERSSLSLAQQLIGAGSTPSQQMNRKQLVQRVRQAIVQLPEADREILLMRTFEGLSNEETACVLNLDPGTASKRHGRALLRLHKLLTDGGLTESQI